MATKSGNHPLSNTPRPSLNAASPSLLHHPLCTCTISRPLRSAPFCDRSVDRSAMDGIQRKPYGFKSNAHQGVATSSSSPGKRKGMNKSSVGGGGGKTKPQIKVVFIDNPVRVTTSEAGFRALVQELTGRHADPYKYNGGSSSGAAIDVDAANDSSGAGSQVEPPAGSLQLPSPVSTPSSDAASAAGAVQVSVPAYDDEDEDSFAPQLIDNSYSVFSPPTFLYGGPHGELL